MGTLLRSGYLPYHLWIMWESSDLITSFEHFEDASPFEPIKLGGNIHHPDGYNEPLHGQLVMFICYKMLPYMDHNRNVIQISFDFGNDMTVNTILGMPIIKDLGMTPNFCVVSMVCKDSTTTFEICCQETSCGFPGHLLYPSH